jgi:SAM-dependent methyltransferase
MTNTPDATAPPTPAPTIRFEDGAGYEKMMGTWSRIVGADFLDWLAPPPGQRWLDVGCGNGAFTESIVERAAPASVHGIDPSPAQLAFARTRPAARLAQFEIGDAQDLRFAAASFDIAVMALVIFFVPDPVRGLAEMRRVVRPGGLVAAYAWDMPGGGFPLAGLQQAMRDAGLPVPMPPSADISGRGSLHRLWADGGLERIQTQAFTVERRFQNFDELWRISQLGTSVNLTVSKLTPDQREALKASWRSRIGVVGDEPVTLGARANAVLGWVAGPTAA